MFRLAPLQFRQDRQRLAIAGAGYGERSESRRPAGALRGKSALRTGGPQPFQQQAGRSDELRPQYFDDGRVSFSVVVSSSTPIRRSSTSRSSESSCSPTLRSPEACASQHSRRSNWKDRNTCRGRHHFGGGLFPYCQEPSRPLEPWSWPRFRPAVSTAFSSFSMKKSAAGSRACAPPMLRMVSICEREPGGERLRLE